MRKFVAISFFSVLSITGLCAQRITFHDTPVSVGYAIDAIREQAQHAVSYNKILLDPNRRIAVRAGGMELRSLLDAIVADESMDYIVRNGAVAFVPVAKQAEVEQHVVPEADVKPAVQPWLLAQAETLALPKPKIQPVTLPALKTEPVQMEFQASTIPNFRVKTNLLHAATATPNLAFEMRVGDRMTLDVPVSHNVWEWRNYSKWKHLLVQPEVRFWRTEAFGGHFLGLHAHYAFYNVGNLPKSFSPYMQTHRFEGWLAGAGLSWGYIWNFNKRWAMEVELGMGYARMEYDKFECVTCNDFIERETKNYFGPTKAAVNLVMNFGHAPQRKSPKQSTKPVSVPAPAPAPAPIVEATTADVATANAPDTILDLTPSFVTPAPKAANERTESGKIYLDFPEGKDEILPHFRNNAAELAQLQRMANEIRKERNARITAVRLRGYASPEGPWQDNKELSQRRMKAFQAYVQANIDLSGAVSDASGEGEDWHGLYRLVEHSDMPHREDVMRIIETVGILSDREKQLMELAGGVPYRYMKERMFPLLRRVDYHIDYTVASSTADTTHILPDSDADNINAAAVALTHRDADTAVKHLFNVKEPGPSWWNNMGIVFYLRGEMEYAASSFHYAGTLGEENAEKLKKHINK